MTPLVLLELVGVVAEGVLIVLMAGAFFVLYRVTRQQHIDMQQQHADSVELLAFIETQIRTTRHAVKNLTAALNLQAATVDGDVAVDVDEEVANR